MRGLRVATALALVAAFSAPAPVLASGNAASSQSQQTHADPRSVVPLDDGWRFRFGDVGDEVTGDGFDDSSWETVSVPHTWNRIGEYALVRSDATNNAQGIGWYRLSFDAPPAPRGSRQILDFAAVGKIADVWVNGHKVGHHAGAFSRFRFDVTNVWNPGGRNLVVVGADNSKVTPQSDVAQIIPLAGDFFVSGGIYRPVELITTNDVAIDLLDHAGPGIYARTVDVREDHGAAQVAIKTRVRNSGKRPRKLTALVRVLDAEGRTVAENATRLTATPGTAQSEVTVEVPSPRLWNGTKDPYLYRVSVELREGNRLLDAGSQPLGIRTFRFDADKGFFLNGKSVPLHGVSRHQDRLGKGWALSLEDHAQDMALIAELGANTVRHAHYQHADEWSDEADRAGMVVWAELPYVGAPSLTGGKGTDALWANAEEQLRELIRQNYNHPSIMMWSIGNEVDSAKAFGAMTEKPNPIELLKRLNEVAKEEDPSRPTVIADFSEQLGEFGKTRQPLTEVPDLIGYNRYPGWYFVQGAMAGRALGGMLDKLHAAHPEKPMSVSEYGAGGATSQHSDDPRSGYVSFAGRPQPEEYQSWVIELLWPAIEQREYLFASWVWNMFDFPSDLRNEGDSVDINTKGLVTFDREIRKDAFYYLKAAWNEAPMVHLAGKRYEDRSYPTMDVKAYTNAARARLSFNGKDMGEIECPNHTCVWKSVLLRPGPNSAEVTAAGISDRAEWNGPDPQTNGIRINSGSLAAEVDDGKRYGSDSFVEGGKPVPRDSGSIGGRREGPPLEITASKSFLFDYWREGPAFSYAIPLPDGRWTVNVHTFEPRKDAPASLRMTVSAEGKPVMAPFNVAEAAGGALREVTRSFPVTVTGGMLELDFSASGAPDAQAVVAAIEIVK